ncbi:sulfotransferase [Bacillus albus]|uniref:sulfotransferase n=1 Tax=Bacillus albus TaxID=2026189 RepID=UPI0018A17159|nr:sulfotransferase [Bacillus albus]MBF7156037.1 sulfotransferase [Bacillus albus]
MEEIKNKFFNGPIVIGGVGGSGTRVIAEILKTIGYYLGDSDNYTNDNLDFFHLFGNPDWFKQNYKENKDNIIRRLRIFENHMLMSLEQNKHEYLGWGWKNPSSHIYIKFLYHHFKQIKYIHVIRHGLDMVYSTNQNQFFKWGDLYNLDLSLNQERLRLQYWYQSNKKAITLGEKFFKKNFFIINFDNLCADPQKEMNNLINFLNLNKSNLKIQQLINLIHSPQTLNRYKNFDLNVFTETDFNLVKEFGFKI